MSANFLGRKFAMRTIIENRCAVSVFLTLISVPAVFGYNFSDYDRPMPLRQVCSSRATSRMCCTASAGLRLLSPGFREITAWR